MIFLLVIIVTFVKIVQRRLFILFILFMQKCIKKSVYSQIFLYICIIDKKNSCRIVTKQKIDTDLPCQKGYCDEYTVR